METTTTNQEKLSANWQASFVTDDLADFLVMHQTLICGDGLTVADIKRMYENSPGLADVVDEVLGKLERFDLIRFEAGRIQVRSTSLEMNSNVESLSKFLPRLFRLGVTRVLRNARTGEHKRRKEFARFFVFPGDADTVSEARALYEEYKAKMVELIARADREQRRTDKARLVGVFGCSMEAEDFA